MRGEGELTGPVKIKPKGSMPGLEGCWISEDSCSVISCEKRDRHLEISACEQWENLVPKSEKGTRPGVNKGHGQSFKLEVKGEGDKTRPTGNEPGGKGPRMRVKSGAQLKCIYANACSMGNKQDELEAIVWQDSCDIVAIMETWWDDGHDWNAAMKGYKLLRRNRQGRRGGGVALYIRECFDCIELDSSDDKVECLRVRMKGKANKGDFVLGVCYRPPNKDKQVDEVFYKWLAEVSQSPALVLVGDFNLSDICWKYNTAESRQARRFLECMEENFLTQLVGEPTRGDALLDLLFTNKEGLVADVEVRGHLGLSDHEMVKFSILSEVRKGVSKTSTLDFRRADFSLFRTLVGRVPWEIILWGKGVQEDWTLFKKEILKAQEQAVPMRCKIKGRGKWPAWLNKELLMGLREKRRVYHLWMKGQAT
ncbi:rna-directed dna polymerase from mobile element jockey-like [Limosa lapponica baueri]|uniref:Rna-directed dna polymerase from mobile element jockey-like n=1 Tax=Limosa lapponica baueri TaxID=1758121 RepID=A0A2I0ULE4_LIMLA|nr:rna-directed dna polymerase from mobile element jockey-like [Limosa lapponica baueri]